MGNGIATNQLMKMVAGAVNPGRPVANLYVSQSQFMLVDATLELNHRFHIQVLDVEP